MVHKTGKYIGTMSHQKERETTGEGIYFGFPGKEWARQSESAKQAVPCHLIPGPGVTRADGIVVQSIKADCWAYRLWTDWFVYKKTLSQVSCLLSLGIS